MMMTTMTMTMMTMIMMLGGGGDGDCDDGDNHVDDGDGDNDNNDNYDYDMITMLITTRINNDNGDNDNDKHDNDGNDNDDIHDYNDDQQREEVQRRPRWLPNYIQWPSKALWRIGWGSAQRRPASTSQPVALPYKHYYVLQSLPPSGKSRHHGGQGGCLFTPLSPSGGLLWQ